MQAVRIGIEAHPQGVYADKLKISPFARNDYKLDSPGTWYDLHMALAMFQYIPPGPSAGHSLGFVVHIPPPTISATPKP